MKGLLKGFRYISQIFEGDEKEQEMEIGFPTDVKHVAHIGWDGPSTTAPSWMNEFRSAPPGATVGNDANDLDASEKFSSAEFQPTGDTPSGEPPRPRPSRRKDSSSAGIDSPGRDPTKQSRRRPSTGATVPMDSPVRDSSDGSRRSRRNRSGGDEGATETDSPQPDLPAVPKQMRRRRTKESSPSSSGGSSRAARNKASESDGSTAEAPPTIPEEGVVV